MKGPALHKLLSSLSKGEKKQFKNYTSGKSEVLLDLFDLLNRQKRYSEKAVLRRYAKKELYRKFDQLRDLIVEALAYYSKDIPKDGFEVVRVAVDLDLKEYAFRKLVELGKDALERMDYLTLYRSYGLLDLLPSNLRFPNEFPEKKVVRALAKKRLQWDEILDGIRRLFSIDHDAGRLLLKDARRKLEIAEKELGPSDGYFQAKARSGIALYENDIPKAIHWQSKVMESLENFDVGPIQWVKEASQMANLSIDFRDWDGVRKWTLTLGNRELPPSAHSKRMEEWITISLFSSIEFGQFETASDAIEQLQNYPEISGTRKAIVYHFASLICLYQNDIRGAVQWVNRLVALSPSERADFTWQPLLVLCLVDLLKGEQETFGSIEDYLHDRLVRSIAGRVETPMVFLQSLKSYWASKSTIELENGLRALARIKDSVPEQVCYRYFYFEEYLFAILKGVSIAEILNDPHPLKQFKAKNYR